MTTRILVPVKRVVDANVRVRVGSSGGIDTTGLKISINPFDECAVEKALRMKEAGEAMQVTVITCGQAVSQDVLRTALAMGADDAVLIDVGAASATLDPLAVAKLLRAFVENNDYGFVLCGKQAIDDDTGGVAAMLAALLGWSQALNASQIDADGDGWKVTCGDDTGTATWKLNGPSVVSADLRLADPRRVTLPSIVKAKQKPLKVIDGSAFGADLTPKFKVLSMAEPAMRKSGTKVATTAELVSAIGRQRLFHNVGAQL
jgi:electron transfer flavoprotein beta subunit